MARQPQTTEVGRTPTENASAMSGATVPTPVAVSATETAPNSARVTWLGDPADPTEVNETNGITFKKGEAVKVEDPRLIAKLRGNRFFKVG